MVMITTLVKIVVKRVKFVAKAAGFKGMLQFNS